MKVVRLLLILSVVGIMFAALSAPAYAGRGVSCETLGALILDRFPDGPGLQGLCNAYVQANGLNPDPFCHDPAVLNACWAIEGGCMDEYFPAVTGIIDNYKGSCDEALYVKAKEAIAGKAEVCKVEAEALKAELTKAAEFCAPCSDANKITMESAVTKIMMASKEFAARDAYQQPIGELSRAVEDYKALAEIAVVEPANFERIEKAIYVADTSKIQAELQFTKAILPAITEVNKVEAINPMCGIQTKPLYADNTALLSLDRERQAIETSLKQVAVIEDSKQLYTATQIGTTDLKMAVDPMIGLEPVVPRCEANDLFWKHLNDGFCPLALGDLGDIKKMCPEFTEKAEAAYNEKCQTVPDHPDCIYLWSDFQSAINYGDCAKAADITKKATELVCSQRAMMADILRAKCFITF